MVKFIGDVGFLFAAVALFLFAVMFLTSVRWWTDPLGRAIAGVVGTVGTIVVVAAFVMTGVPIPYINWWRAILYPLLAITAWGGTIAFFWAQFIVPRRSKVRSHQRTSRKERT